MKLIQDVTPIDTRPVPRLIRIKSVANMFHIKVIRKNTIDSTEMLTRLKRR